MEKIYPAQVKTMLELHFINVGDGGPSGVDFTIYEDGSVLTHIAAAAAGGRYCDYIRTV